MTVDKKTWWLMWERTFSECLARKRGDRGEAYRLAMYYMRNWEIQKEGKDADRSKA